jgi:hypothetical protein
MVLSLTSGESKPVYEGLFMVEGYNDGYFFPTWAAA